MRMRVCKTKAHVLGGAGHRAKARVWAMRVAVDEGGHLGCEENIAALLSVRTSLYILSSWKERNGTKGLCRSICSCPSYKVVCLSDCLFSR